MSKLFEERQGTISDNIIWLIKNHPQAVDDYRKLFIYYWYYVNGLPMFVPQKIVERLDQPESIGRAFRKLVEQGYIIVDEKTKKARLKEEENYRRYYGGKNW